MFKVILTTTVLLFSNFSLGASLAITLSDQDGNAVEDAVVHVLTIDGQTQPVQPMNLEVDQVDEAFVPHVRAATVGSSVNFPNSDHVRHHVYSFSEARSFELPLYIGIPTEPVVFDKAGIVTLGCNIHDHMLGYILVLESPYFAEISHGTGLIDALPAGELRVEIWHPRLAADIAPVHTLTVGAGEQAVLDAQIELRPERMVRRAPRRDSNRY
jgi:plastocyanin